jgi:hypothetical protein
MGREKGNEGNKDNTDKAEKAEVERRLKGCSKSIGLGSCKSSSGASSSSDGGAQEGRKDLI